MDTHSLKKDVPVISILTVGGTAAGYDGQINFSGRSVDPPTIQIGVRVLCR